MFSWKPLTEESKNSGGWKEAKMCWLQSSSRRTNNLFSDNCNSLLLPYRRNNANSRMHHPLTISLSVHSTRTSRHSLTISEAMHNTTSRSRLLGQIFLTNECSFLVWMAMEQVTTTCHHIYICNMRLFAQIHNSLPGCDAGQRSNRCTLF